MNNNLSSENVRISVCLACFNGEKYIIEQVTSIILQMGPFDELIISDNGSSDMTLTLLATVTDNRVRVLDCVQKGVTHNFEYALMHAKGHTIILCDQDDVWLPGRLEAAHLALRHHDLSIVGLQYVDELLVALVKSPIIRSPKVSLLSTIIFNGYTGCCMAFRRELLEFILPFPKLVPMHDWWIALVALGISADISISDQQLILYRRHGSNISSTGASSGFNLAKKLSMRIFITLNLAVRLLRLGCFLNIFSKSRGIRFKIRDRDLLNILVNKNERRPRFVVCLAAYNGMAYVAEQIESILLQKNVDLQIFVSVDHSNDGTEYFLAEWALSEPRLTLLPFNQRFGGAGPNFYRLLRDVDLSGFDYLSFADQDDSWHTEKLWRAHCLMIKQGALGYSSNVTAFWPSGKTQLVRKSQPQRSYDFMFEAAGPGCTYVLQISLALSLQKMVRAAHENLLRIDYHDWLIYAFARTNKCAWIIDEWSSMQYRQHANNQIGVNSGWHSYWLRVRKMLSGHGVEQSLLIADLVHAFSTPVVQKGLLNGRLGYLWLALRANQCRRKPLDRLWFFILCILFIVVKPNGRNKA